jgi:hypothetical protein
MPLVPYGEDRFYGEHSGHRHLPVVFPRDEKGQITNVMIIGQPFHRIELKPEIEPDPALWRSFAGIYKDPSNPERGSILSIRWQGGRLLVAKGEREAPCSAIGQRSFLCDHGLIEFERDAQDGAEVLLWGKATRYYPLDPELYRAKGIIEYAVDVPVVPPRIL